MNDWARGQEDTGEGTASVAVEGPGLKGSCRELRIKSWHHEEISREAVGKSAVAFGDANTKGRPPGIAAEGCGADSSMEDKLWDAGGARAVARLLEDPRRS